MSPTNQEGRVFSRILLGKKIGMSKKEKKQRQIYASAVSPLEKGGALLERSINPPRSPWHPMRHRRCSVSPRPEGWQGSGMLHRTVVHLSLTVFPALPCFLERRYAVSGEAQGRQCHRWQEGAKPLSWAQLCSKVRVDKSRLLSSRLLWCCDPTMQPLCACRCAFWRTTLDLISVLLCSSWWDFAIKSVLFSYKQTSITAPTRVIFSMLIYLINDCEISLIV